MQQARARGQAAHGGGGPAGGGGSDPDTFVEQLKLLPFLVKASQGGVEGQLEMYEHEVRGAAYLLTY